MTPAEAGMLASARVFHCVTTEASSASWPGRPCAEACGDRMRVDRAPATRASVTLTDLIMKISRTEVCLTARSLRVTRGRGRGSRRGIQCERLPRGKETMRAEDEPPVCQTL